MILPEQPLITEIPTQKIYKDRAIWAGTFMGGPLVAGYLIAENFKVFKEPDKAKKSWIYAIIITILIFGAVFLIPDSVKIPRQIIPIIYTAIAYYLVQHYQGENINSHINSGGQTYNWWRALGIGVIGAIITLIPIIAIVCLSDATTASTTKTYGTMNHEIVFDKNNISETEIDKLANGLTTTTFFDDALKKSAYIKKVNSDYEISIPCDPSVISNSGTLAPFIQLRNDMQALYPHNKIIINLVVDHLDNVVKRIE